LHTLSNPFLCEDVGRGSQVSPVHRLGGEQVGRLGSRLPSHSLVQCHSRGFVSRPADHARALAWFLLQHAEQALRRVLWDEGHPAHVHPRRCGRFVGAWCVPRIFCAGAILSRWLVLTCVLLCAHLPVQLSRTTLLSAKTVSDVCITCRVLFDRLSSIQGNSVFRVPLTRSAVADGAKARLKDAIDSELARNLSTAK